MESKQTHNKSVTEDAHWKGDTSIMQQKLISDLDDFALNVHDENFIFFLGSFFPYGRHVFKC